MPKRFREIRFFHFVTSGSRIVDLNSEVGLDGKTLLESKNVIFLLCEFLVILEMNSFFGFLLIVIVFFLEKYLSE